MSEKKKILHLITGLELGGGAESMLFQFLPNMQTDLDNQVCVIKGEGEIGKKLEKAKIPVHYLKLKSILDMGIIFRYKKMLKKFNPDVQVNYLIHADIFGRIFGKIFGVKKIVPYIRNIHRNRKFLMFLDKITLPLADFILTNSETARKYYIEKMDAKADRIKCIPNGVDLSLFENLNVNRKEKLKEIKIPDNAFVIGTVARLEKQKDIATLIKAFFEVNKKYSKTYLLLIGHGGEKENIKRLVAKLRLEKKVIFLEKRKDIPELLQIMDIFILPSLNEGMSNALLEAMASQKVIITSDTEENIELVRNNYNGLNFKTGDANDLADKISSCISNGEKYEYFKNKTSSLIGEKYDIKIVTQKFKYFLNN
ncbi:MAG: hypothetical protein COX31_01905 [Candidatus Moranbacteria bacterium CG23_combo_of_CG06-09_8_20_14_all_40_16]|nr:MAG: hypothetical protein COX31_01905 [Candidatus Moranbacteria bacterium CG23_combo_of_CG06-09_8_20_14_all_40_16]